MVNKNEVRTCLYCHAEIIFDGDWWRDNTPDPGDGFGGDASCPAQPAIHGRMQAHVPEPVNAVDNNEPQYVIAVTLSNQALLDLSGDQSIEALCETLNSLMPHDIQVRPLSEIIAC